MHAVLLVTRLLLPLLSDPALALADASKFRSASENSWEGY
jgi:hypothetical protein